MAVHKYELAPAMALICSMVLVYHATFCINSLAHVHGTKRYNSNHQLSWWFDGEPLKAVLKDFATFGMGLWDH